jgi:hypothetical protein
VRGDNGNGASLNGQVSVSSPQDDRCRVYEMALRRVIHEQPDGAGAEIANAALRLFGEG